MVAVLAGPYKRGFKSIYLRVGIFSLLTEGGRTRVKLHRWSFGQLKKETSRVEAEYWCVSNGDISRQHVCLIVLLRNRLVASEAACVLARVSAE